MLLDEGELEIEAPDPMDAEKALGHAAIKGHGNICRILVANNADPNSPMIDAPILTQIITEYYANKVPVLTDTCHKSTPEECFCSSSLGSPRYRRQSC